jgi:hypothetical protein
MFNINITVSLDPAQYTAFISRLDDIKMMLSAGSQERADIVNILAELEDNVSASTSARQNFRTLITNILNMIEAAKTNPVRLQAVLDTVKNNNDRLIQMALDNTPTPV